jgi:hypothetical protein
MMYPDAIGQIKNDTHSIPCATDHTRWFYFQRVKGAGSTVLSMSFRPGKLIDSQRF